MWRAPGFERAQTKGPLAANWSSPSGLKALPRANSGEKRKLSACCKISDLQNWSRKQRRGIQEVGSKGRVGDANNSLESLSWDKAPGPPRECIFALSLVKLRTIQASHLLHPKPNPELLLSPPFLREIIEQRKCSSQPSHITKATPRGTVLHRCSCPQIKAALNRRGQGSLPKL